MLRRNRLPLEPQSFELTLLADYFQVHVWDDGGQVDLGEAWTEEAVSRGLAVDDGIVGMGTARNLEVPVAVTIYPEPPELQGDADSVVEADLECISGRVVVMGCTDYGPDALRIHVPPGWYRVRASARGLRTVRENGLEGDDEYRIDLWPAAPTGVTVVKSHSWVESGEVPLPDPRHRR